MTDQEKQVGTQLRRLRLERDLSQKRLAERMAALGGPYEKWRQSTIDKTEKGLRPIRVNEMFDLAAVLGVAPEVLLTWEVSGEVLDAQIAEVEQEIRNAEQAHEEAREQLAGMEQVREASERAEREWAERVARRRATLEVLRRLRKNVQRAGAD